LNFSVILFNKDTIYTEINENWIEIDNLIIDQMIISELDFSLYSSGKCKINLEYFFVKHICGQVEKFSDDLLIHAINSSFKKSYNNIDILDSPLQSEFILNSYLNSNKKDFILKLIPTKINSNRDSDLQINHINKNSFEAILNTSHDLNDIDINITESKDSLTNSSPHEIQKEDPPKISFLNEKSFNSQMVCEIIPYDENNCIENDFLEKKRGDNFCEGFFISGIPIYEPEILKDSNELNSECGHRNCSFLPAYEPEILFRYPEKDFTNFELTSTVSYMIINFVLILSIYFYYNSAF